MGKRVWVLLVILVVCVSSRSLIGYEGDAPVEQATVETGPGQSGEVPIDSSGLAWQVSGHFIENQGQVDDEGILFYAVGDPLSIGFGVGYVQYVVRGEDPADGTVVRIAFEGSDPVQPLGVKALSHPTSFFLGNDPTCWVSGARSYQEVHYAFLWKGIDLRFHLDGGRLKYEFLVAPGADPSRIALRYEGVNGLRVEPDTGDLLVSTSVRTIRDQVPWTYQVVDGAHRSVTSGYRIADGTMVDFSLGAYLPTLPLVIDPGIGFSTYLGGSSVEEMWDSDVDGSGNIYVTGTTASNDFPMSSGAYCSTFGGSFDIFVAKLSSNGSSLQYATYLGGTDYDDARGIAVDVNGMVYIGGYSNSTNYPVTTGANQTTLAGKYDCVVTKLNATGTGLEYSTYVGGSNDDYAWGLALDSSGSAYIGGQTGDDFPTTTGAFEEDWQGLVDGFVVKLSTDGSKLEYSTYVGGGNDDRINAITIDTKGCVFATGHTGSASTSFPVTGGSFCTTKATGDDAFALKMNAAGTGLHWCGFINGATAGGYGHAIAVDRWGSAYVGGVTKCPTLPVLNWSYDDTLNGIWDGFLVEIDNNGTYFSYVTYLGGKGTDRIYDLTFDSKNRLHIVGQTSSTDFPTTLNAYDGTKGTGYDVFYTIFGQYGTSFEYSTFIGGDGDDNATSVNVDPSGIAVVAGTTQSTDFPTTTGAYCTTDPGGWDGFIFKMGEDKTPPTIGPDHTVDQATAGRQILINVTIGDDEGVKNASVEYWSGNGSHSSKVLRLVSGDAKDGLYQWRIRASSGSLDPVHYIIHATDDAGNTNSTNVQDITVVDDQVPWINDYTPWYNVPHTGDLMQFVANVSDNLGISEVVMIISIGDPTWLEINTSMDPWFVWSNGAGTYGYNFTVPANSTDAIFYNITATDTSGNRYGISNELNVTDNDAPAVGPDASDTVATTGDVFHIQVDMNDNIGVVGVFVNIHIGGPSTSNYTMDPVVIAPNGNGTWEYNLTIPHALGTWEYTFHVVDDAGNWNLTDRVAFDLIDNDPPVLGPNGSHSVGDDRFHFEVNVTENVGIDQVWVVYTHEGQMPVNVSLNSINAVANGTGTYGNVEIPVPMDIQVRLDYTLGAMDTSGQVTIIYDTYVNLDFEVPEFGEDGTWGEPVKGWAISVWVEVFDNLGIDEVRVEYWFGDGRHENDTMVPEGAVFNYSIQLPRWPAGDLWYLFHAYDFKANWNVTIEHSVVLVNKAPVVEAGLTWEVPEGQTKVFVLTPYITDENDVLADISVATEAPGVTADRQRLTLLYDEWMADHQIEITVTDGEDYITAFIDVHVININDAPYFTSEPPTVGNVGTEYEYQVTFIDEDPADTHTFSLNLAPAGMEVDGSGRVTWTPTEDQESEYSIDLVLSDSTEMIHQTWTVDISPPANRAPSFTNSPPLVHMAGAVYTWTAEAEDPDEDPLTYALVDGPDNATVHPTTGLLEWVPPANRRDTSENVDFTVRASDGLLYVDLGFTVLLNYPQNQPPVVQEGLEDITVRKDTSVDLAPYMQDPDDPKEALYWEATTGSDLFKEVSMMGNVLVLKSKDNIKGTAMVTLSLYDAWGLADTHELTVTVDTKEDEEGNLLASFWWVIIIMIVIVVALYLAQDKWRPKKGAELEVAIEEETE